MGSICAGCFAKCSSCSDFVTCNTCNLEYFLSSTSTQCTPCGNNCLICSSASNCSSCAEGYAIASDGSCSPQNCNSSLPFCLNCASNSCLICSQGKYLSNGVCLQSGSILCLASVGPYQTTCDSSSFGCPSYADIQIDSSLNTQLPVCLPKKATKIK